MLNLLLSEAAGAGAQPAKNSWVIYVILIVLVVVMLVLPSISNKKRMKEYNDMLDKLRVGDEVRTIGGVIGKVVKLNTKGEVKTFTLETGVKGSKTTMEFDLASVGTVLKSKYVEEVQTKEDKKAKKEVVETQVEEVKAEEEVETPTEEVNVEEVKEEKTEPKKVAAKKTTKKTSKK